MKQKQEINEKKQEINETMIRLKTDTVEMLQSLKLIERESYDNVVKRLALRNLTEDQLDINDKTKKILLQRMKKIQEGKVKSSRQLLDSLIKREVARMGRKGKKLNKENNNPRGLQDDATIYD